MRALKILTLAGLGLGLAACGGEAPSDQNIAVDNIEAPTDVDVLPMEESSAANTVVNGTTDDINVTTADNQTDGY